MWSSTLKRIPRRSELARRIIVAGWIGTCPGSVVAVTHSQAQQLLPDSHDELANQDRFAWTLGKLPPQPYMNEIYWRQYASDTPAFFRDSLVQFVARTYYLTRDNSDGSRSQAWAAGGWLAFRSGLVGDVFGVHAAVYTSQPIFAPFDQGGTRLLAAPQNSIGVLGQVYGRVQIGDQEIRGGRQLVDTPLVNPQDNRMVPNTFEAVTLVSLPDRDRNYDYAAGYIWNVKQRDSERFHFHVGCVGERRRRQPWRGLRDGQIPAGCRTLAYSHELQRPGLHQHRLRPGRVRFQAADGGPKLDGRRQRYRPAKRRS